MPTNNEQVDQFAAPSPLQAPVETVNPSMIGANDSGDEAIALEQFMPTVLANIVEGTQLTVCTPHRKNALALNVAGNVTAGFA